MWCATSIALKFGEPRHYTLTFIKGFDIIYIENEREVVIMVDKKEFVRLANKFIEYLEKWNKATDLLGENSGEGFIDNILSLTSDCLAAATDNTTLNPLYDDDNEFAAVGYDCPIVIWWIYWTDCGETMKGISVNGQKFDISTAAKLYHFIVYARRLEKQE